MSHLNSNKKNFTNERVHYRIPVCVRTIIQNEFNLVHWYRRLRFKITPIILHKKQFDKIIYELDFGFIWSIYSIQCAAQIQIIKLDLNKFQFRIAEFNSRILGGGTLYCQITLLA